MNIGVNNVPFIVPLPVLAARFAAIIIAGFVKRGSIAVDELMPETNKDQSANHQPIFIKIDANIKTMAPATEIIIVSIRLIRTMVSRHLSSTWVSTLVNRGSSVSILSCADDTVFLDIAHPYGFAGQSESAKLGQFA